MSQKSRAVSSLLILTALFSAVVSYAGDVEDDFNSQTARTSGIPNFFEASPGIFRGGRPNQEGMDFLAQRGVRYIINLENDHKAIEREQAWATERSQSEELSPMDPFKSPDDREITRLEGILHNPTMRPIFVHCQHGQDRTGLVMGLNRVLNEGWTPGNAFEEMKQRGYHTLFVRMTKYFQQRTGFQMNLLLDTAGFDSF